jgi:hypothetical protein
MKKQPVGDIPCELTRPATLPRYVFWCPSCVGLFLCTKDREQDLWIRRSYDPLPLPRPSASTFSMGPIRSIPTSGGMVTVVEIREDWFPLDRCTDAAVATRGLDPPFGTTYGGVFPNARRVL